MNERSEEDTLELLRAAQAGCESAFSALFERYSPLIDAACRQYAEGVPSEQELRSEALAALWHAISRFDTEQKEVTFGLYAKICVGNRLIDCQRRWRHTPTTLSLDSEELARMGADDSSNPAAQIVEREQYLALWRHMKKILSPRECRVWELFIEGRTASEIASALGISKRSVENAVFRARNKLRKSPPPRL